MTEFDTMVLHGFWFIGYVAGFLACLLIILVGLVLCIQIPWWLCRNTEAWLRVRKIVKHYQRRHDRMRRSNVRDDGRPGGK